MFINLTVYAEGLNPYILDGYIYKIPKTVPLNITPVENISTPIFDYVELMDIRVQDTSDEFSHLTEYSIFAKPNRYTLATKERFLGGFKVSKTETYTAEMIQMLTLRLLKTGSVK